MRSTRLRIYYCGTYHSILHFSILYISTRENCVIFSKIVRAKEICYTRPAARNLEQAFHAWAKIAYSSIAYDIWIRLEPLFKRRSQCAFLLAFSVLTVPLSGTSISVATSQTNPLGLFQDLGFADLRRATSKWNTLLCDTAAHAVVETYVGSDRFVTPRFFFPLSFPPRLSLTQRVRVKSLEEFSLIVSALFCPQRSVYFSQGEGRRNFPIAD